MTLLLLAAALAAPTGALVVHVAPADATVEVDGAALGAGPTRSAALPPGAHNVDVARQGFVPLHQVVTVAAEGTACVSVTLTRAPLPPPDPAQDHARRAREAIAASVVAGVAAGAAGRPAVGSVDAPGTPGWPNPAAVDPALLQPGPAPGAAVGTAPPPVEVAAPCP